MVYMEFQYLVNKSNFARSWNQLTNTYLFQGLLNQPSFIMERLMNKCTPITHLLLLILLSERHFYYLMGTNSPNSEYKFHDSL